MASFENPLLRAVYGDTLDEPEVQDEVQQMYGDLRQIAKLRRNALWPIPEDIFNEDSQFERGVN
jgi:hypothetical protein